MLNLVRVFRVALSLFVILLSADIPLAMAQTAAYTIAGPAGVSGFFGSKGSWHAAGGGEFVLPARIGIGGEGGFLDSLFVFSLNGSLHFAGNRPSQKLAPFVTAGYTRMGSGEGSFNAWNIGAGANYWVGRRVGVRMEFRDHVRPDVRGTVQYWTVRAGGAFR